MVLQGVSGGGKTTYISGLKNKLPQDFNCQVLEPSEIETPQALAMQLRQIFSLSTLHSDHQINNLELVEQIVQRQKHCILVVDNAQLLADDVIIELVNCIQSQKNDVYFHCLLVGDDLLTNRFNGAPLSSFKDQASHLFEMPELPVSDIKDFLKFKFASLGLVQVAKLSDDHISKLMAKSKKNLSVLTQLASQEITGAENKVEKTKLISLSHFKNINKGVALFTTGVGCLFLVVSMLVRSPSDNTTIQQQTLSLPGQLQAQKEEVIQSFKAKKLASTVNLMDKNQKKMTANPNFIPLSMIPKHKSLGKYERKSEPESEASMLARRDELNRAPIQTRKTETHLKLSQESLKGTGQEPSIDRQLSAIKASRLHQQKMQEKKGVVDSVLAVPTPKPIVEKQALPKTHIKPQARAIKKEHVKPIEKKIARSKKTDLSVAAKQVRQVAQSVGKGYGIQLIASKELSAAKKFAADHQLQSQAKYYKVNSKGKLWYVLVVGDYGSKAQAIKASAKLSKKLKGKKPWIRSIKNLPRVQTK